MLAAQQALLSCPTASIGDVAKRDMHAAVASLPMLLDRNIYFCGYTSERSFGAISYLIVRENGNVLVDSPRFTEPLARRIEELGGVHTMLLTHRDDVADHDKFAMRFDCRRVLHKDDVTIRTRGVELQPEGDEPVAIDEDIVMIPTPGHTRGHAVYLYHDRDLFTGDHLAWDPDGKRLEAFDDACWYSWEEQIRSMEKLLAFGFESVLPGHGRRVQLPREVMRAELERCIDWMRTRE